MEKVKRKCLLVKIKKTIPKKSKVFVAKLAENNLLGTCVTESVKRKSSSE
jgi:hypothetical protein